MIMKKIFCALMCMVLAFAALPTAVSAEESKIKVACVGDSITNGNANFCDYPSNLQKFLDADKYEVKNFGFGGTTAMKNPNVVPSYWSVQQYEDSKAFLPDIVIIMLGTNDVVNENWNLDNYKNDLTELVEVYQNLSSSPDIYLCSPPSAFDASHPQKIKDYAIPTVKSICQSTGATYVDINTLTADMGSYFTDGIHPNNEGYVKLAEIFYKEIFDGESVELTLKADAGIKVLYGGQQKTFAGNETFKVTTGNGTKSVKIEKAGVGFTYVDFTVKGETTADLRGAEIPENLAFSASATDKAGATTKPNDGDASTGWQRDNGDAYGTDVWLQYDFGGNKKISNMELEWEIATRAIEGKYKLTYSTDGSTWKEFSNLKITYGASIDSVSFNEVSARYVKLVISEGAHDKFRPSLYEWRVFKAAKAFTPTVTYASGGNSSSESAPSSDISSTPSVESTPSASPSSEPSSDIVSDTESNVASAPESNVTTGDTSSEEPPVSSEESTPVSSEQPVSSDAAANSDNGMSFWYLIPIGAAVVIAVGLAVFMVIKKNKGN